MEHDATDAMEEESDDEAPAPVTAPGPVTAAPGSAPTNILFIAGLPKEVTAEMLLPLFQQCVTLPVMDLVSYHRTQLAFLPQIPRLVVSQAPANTCRQRAQPRSRLCTVRDCWTSWNSTGSARWVPGGEGRAHVCVVGQERMSSCGCDELRRGAEGGFEVV